MAPSFIAFQLAFDGVRRETLRLPWFEGAVINENIDENVAEYFMRMDPLNPNKDLNDEQKQEAKEKAKASLTGAVQKLQKVKREAKRNRSSVNESFRITMTKMMIPVHRFISI